MKFGDFVKVKSLSHPQNFKENLDRLGLAMPCDESLESGETATMAQSKSVSGLQIGNRYAIHPMEGWDGQADGNPSENTHRRWTLFGRSGAKLIWGGEAVAVRPDGRANPRQLVMSDQTKAGIAQLREGLVHAHRETMGSDQGLVIGLQLTHSGRFCKPHLDTRMEPRVLYKHPLLDGRFGPKDNIVILSDGDIHQLIDDYVLAAKRAWECGFQFVDLKHCHGYLGHEFLSAKTRDGEFGGSLHNRTRFIRELAQGIRATVPGLALGVRLSAVDFLPFTADPNLSDDKVLGPGIPVDHAHALPYHYGFGIDPANPMLYALDETVEFLKVLESLDIALVNVTVGSPYYTPHVTRPALYPPSDGYQPPEDPLIGVMRHLEIVRDLKKMFPNMAFVGSGYTYLQEFLPYVAQAVVQQGWTDFVGLGRMVLAYPELPADVLAGRPLQRKRLCRTFSDCTTAPRNGLVSGCYPLDAHYKKSPQMAILTQFKKAAKLA
jgi:2,4-dienoyl-CoA reductase-like NADH-dependent reductase (Old Yellow Enzyme family)